MRKGIIRQWTGIVVPAVMVVLMAAAPPVHGSEGSAACKEISFKAADGVEIFGDLCPASESKAGPLILLFHQAGGDARGEYGGIIPRLVKAGYHVLAIDQRRGGTRFGGTNRTMQGTGGKEYSYCEAYPDLQAALTWITGEGYTGKRAAWGSSYSAALVIRLGVERRDELNAVLAFSPASGDPMGDCNPDPFARKIKIPAFALRPAGEMERERARKQLALYKELGFNTYVADPGTHGSSMLVPERAGGDTESTWMVVLGFLNRTLGSGN